MSEPVEQKRGLLAMFTRKNMRDLAIAVIASSLSGAVVDFLTHSDKQAELWGMRAQAYVSIAQFAPWNIAQRYVAIVTTQGNSYAEELAKKQEQQNQVFRDFACNLRGNSVYGGFNLIAGDNPCVAREHPQGLRAFYLSAHVPAPLRLITAFFDLLLHALIDQGVIGFLVAAMQVLLGVLVTRFVIRYKKIKIETVYGYMLGVPLAVLALGSVFAVPLWLLALVGLMALKTLPIAGLGAQAGGTTWLATFLFSKTAEVAGEKALVKQAKRVLGG